ncbi:hypothetical protein POM88_002406 [Heracleum sosnowskyi]|uniref:PPC domain-containing protein n=1 Tax=Heracleum sosnowskyi TaxID=360622 RepID=A0AAD8JFM4_9APIA|nr:hypothetical protein POM88_002406 [Heracleum sosnowskyi]
MNNSKNLSNVNNPVGFSDSSSGAQYHLNLSPMLPNMDTSMSNIGGTPAMLPNIDIPMSDFGNIPPNLSSMEFSMFDTENIEPVLSNMESSMLDNTNGISHGGVTLPYVGTPMFNIPNGVTHGSGTLPNSEIPNFIANDVSFDGVTLPNLDTPMSNVTNGVPYGGAILPNMEQPMFNNSYGVPYGSITFPNMDSPMFNNTFGVLFGNSHRGRPPGSKNKPKGENSSMKSVILKVPAGTDLVDWVVGFAKEKKVHITVQGGNVAVSEAHISFLATPKIYKGHFNLFNFSGACMFSGSKEGFATYFNAQLSKEGTDNVFGGAASKIITMDEMVLSASVFKNPELLKIKLKRQELVIE